MPRKPMDLGTLEARKEIKRNIFTDKFKKGLTYTGTEIKNKGRKFPIYKDFANNSMTIDYDANFFSLKNTPSSRKKAAATIASSAKSSIKKSAIRPLKKK